jgi:hypothetical protein
MIKKVIKRTINYEALQMKPLTYAERWPLYKNTLSYGPQTILL